MTTKELIHKWRAQANGHLRRGRGEKRREHALKHLAQAGIYRLCASELERETDPDAYRKHCKEVAG